MARALKVYRTPIGFHDAYVAAPSQKAALEAWGSDANLFARGVAELVTEPDLTAEPLANPGKVIKRLRGTAAEHFEALPQVAKARSKANRSQAATDKPVPAVKSSPKRPSRAKLAAAEQRVAETQARQQSERDELAARETALRAERKRLESRLAAETGKLKARLQAATESYEAALEAWRREA